VLAAIALAWLSLLVMNLQHGMHSVAAMHHAPIGGPGFLLILVMWWFMAIAMMLPTAIPALEVLEELDDTARRKKETAGQPLMFALGFTCVWIAFGLAATMIQYGMHNAALLTPAGTSASGQLSAALFVLAGVYQWTPMKQACVSKCRSPMSFFLSYWEAGNRGYTRMGLRMGKYCLGCCWAMMLLMFALGVMNLLWMGLLTVYMYIEKNWVRQPWLDRVSGLVLVSVGVMMLI
jgi:predicted metal-binding membrane protein